MLAETMEPGWIPLGAKVLVLERSLLGSDWVPRKCWWKQGNLAESHWGARALVLERKELAWIPLCAKELLVGTMEPGWTPLGAKVLVLERSLLGSHWLPRNCWWKQGDLAGSHGVLRY